MSNPKLRFKREDGTDFPEWNNKRIGEILSLCHGKDYKHLEIGDIPVMGTGGVITYVNKALCDWECVCIGRKGTIDRPYYMDKPFWSVDTLFYSKPLGENMPKFQYYLFQNINWQLYNEASGVPSLSASTIEDVRANVPCLKEQQKIADFLSSVDEVIAQSEAEINNLQQQKKAAMQKIFSQDVRFKREDGTDYPEWKFSSIEDEFDFFNGVAHEKDAIAEGKYIIVNSKFISTDGEVQKYTNTVGFPLQRNDIVMVMSDVPNGRAIAKCYLIDQDNTYTLNQRICCLRSSHNQSFMLNQISRNKYFIKFDDGVKQTNLRKNDVLSCPIFVPCLEEQQRIADFLSAYDEAIDYAKQELDKWCELKKGLLQQMFV